MPEKEFIAFLFQTLLKEEFGSKRAMARKLNIQLRTLQENFQHLSVAKGGTVIFPYDAWCSVRAVPIRSMRLAVSISVTSPFI